MPGNRRYKDVRHNKLTNQVQEKLCTTSCFKCNERRIRVQGNILDFIPLNILKQVNSEFLQLMKYKDTEVSSRQGKVTAASQQCHSTSCSAHLCIILTDKKQPIDTRWSFTTID
jgi:hypothetical protein